MIIFRDTEIPPKIETIVRKTYAKSSMQIPKTIKIVYAHTTLGLSIAITFCFEEWSY
jgi:hypothetical protein